MKSFLTSLTIFAFSFTLLIPAPSFAAPTSKAPESSKSTSQKADIEPIATSQTKAVDSKLIDGLAHAIANVLYEAMLEKNRNSDTKDQSPVKKGPINKFLLKRKIKKQLVTLISSTMLQEETFYTSGTEPLETKLDQLALKFSNEYYELLKAIVDNEEPLALKTKSRQTLTTLFEAYLASAIYFNESRSISAELQKYSKWVAISAAAMYIPTQFEDTIMPSTGSMLLATSTLSYALLVYLKDKNNPYNAVEGLFRHPVKKLFSSNKSKLRDTLVTYFWSPVLDNFDSLQKEAESSEKPVSVLVKAHSEEIKSLIKSGKTSNDFKILSYVIKSLQNEVNMNCVDLLTDI